MTTAKPGVERLTGWAGAALAAGDLPDWLNAVRDQARSETQQAVLPSQKAEAWRYTSIEPLLQQEYVPVTEAPGVDAATIDALSLLGGDAWRVVLVNGRFDAALSRLDGLPQGAMLGSLREISGAAPAYVRESLTQVAAGGNLFATINTAGWEDGFALHLEAGFALHKPVEVIHLSVQGALPHVAQPRHLVVLEKGAKATVVERYVGTEGARYCNNGVLEMAVGEDADLTHDRLQEESAQAFHVAGVYVRLGARSRFRGVHFAVGAQWSRTDIDIAFTGAGARCELNGLYLTGDKQLTDYHVNVAHDVPGCASEEHFRGIVYGRGRAVFDGRVFVAKDAQKTDAHLSNRNLLLSTNAEVDTKPWLEILADDVKCSHGTTVGQLDDNMIYYLRSRGIPEAQAKQLLCIGFAGEILSAITADALRGHAEGVVRERLGQAVAVASA